MDLKKILQEIEEQKAILLDVREKNEWEEEHLKHAILVPLSSLQKEIPSHLPKEKKIYIHCRAGGRASLAEKILKNNYNAIALNQSFETLKQASF